MDNLPIVGAALPLDEVEAHRDWLLELPRDLELQDFVDGAVLDGDWSAKVNRAKALLDGHEGRLGIHGPFWGLNIACPDLLVREAVTKRFMQGLDVCQALGANQMVIHSPYTTWSYNNLDNRDGQREKLIDDCHKTMATVVKRAEDMGCVLVIENIEDINPRDRLELADSFNSDAVALSVDTGHAFYAHGTNGAPPVDYYVSSAGKRLAHVHLQDADGYADRHWALGRGTLNWYSIFDALARIDNNPRLIIELRDKSGVRSSAAHLASLGLAR